MKKPLEGDLIASHQLHNHTQTRSLRFWNWVHNQEQIKLLSCIVNRENSNAVSRLTNLIFILYFALVSRLQAKTAQERQRQSIGKTWFRSRVKQSYSGIGWNRNKAERVEIKLGSSYCRRQRSGLKAHLAIHSTRSRYKKL